VISPSLILVVCSEIVPFSKASPFFSRRVPRAPGKGGIRFSGCQRRPFRRMSSCSVVGYSLSEIPFLFDPKDESRSPNFWFFLLDYTVSKPFRRWGLLLDLISFLLRPTKSLAPLIPSSPPRPPPWYRLRNGLSESLREFSPPSCVLDDFFGQGTGPLCPPSPKV